MNRVKNGRQPTVVDVGAIAGVSRQTVSNVLNNPEIVAPETRAKVQDAIALLNYRPHASARRLRTRKSSTIGIRLDPVQNGISGAVLDRFLHALTEQADERGMRIMLFTAKDPWDEIQQIQRLIDGADVDSFVLTSTSYDDPRIDWLINHGTDFVTFGRPWGKDPNDAACRWVDVDARAGVAEATEHLIADGARRIAYLGWPARSGSGDERRAGWYDTMIAASRGTPEELERLELTVEDSVPAAAAALAQLLQRQDPVDAVVCASDSLALGATMVLDAKVPVVGFDDTPVASAIGFPSVKQPLEEVARATLDLLLNPLLHDDSASISGASRALIQPTLAWRERVRA